MESVNRAVAMMADRMSGTSAYREKADLGSRLAPSRSQLFRVGEPAFEELVKQAVRRLANVEAYEEPRKRRRLVRLTSSVPTRSATSHAGNVPIHLTPAATSEPPPTISTWKPPNLPHL